MKILAIVALVIVGFLVDAIMAFLASLGVLVILTYIVPILVWGSALELISARGKEHNFLVKALRVIIFGIIFSVVLIANIPWILKPVILIAIITAAVST